MKIYRKLAGLKKYASIAITLGRCNNKSYGWIFLKMLLCRLLRQHNALLYAAYGFDNKPISQWWQYLSKKNMLHLQRRINLPLHAYLVHDKLLFSQRCRQHKICTPKNLAVVATTNADCRAMPLIKDRESLVAFLQETDAKAFFLKTACGAWGEGALAIKLQKNAIYDFFGNRITPESIIAHCARYHTNFIVQRYLAVHHDIAQLMPGPALGTFRLVTLLTNSGNEVLIPYAFAKIPVQGNITDNFFHGQTGNIICRIDIVKGKLVHAVGVNPQTQLIASVERHPDTDMLLADFLIPKWEQMLQLVIRAAQIFPELNTLGWDVALTSEGLCLIEANCYYDPDALQLTLKRGMKTELRDLYGKV